MTFDDMLEQVVVSLQPAGKYERSYSQKTHAASRA